MPTPSEENGNDVYLWRNRQGGFWSSFLSSVTWKRTRTPSPTVPWHSVVWFRREISCCSFITWTAYLGRLPTRNRLLSWGMLVQPDCVLCYNALESHTHFFVSILALAAQLHGPHAALAIIVMKLLNQVITYNLWHERNARIFQEYSTLSGCILQAGRSEHESRLLSLPLVTAASHFFTWALFLVCHPL